MRSILPIAQKLLITNQKIPQDKNTVEIIVELIEEVMRLADENDQLRARIHAAQIELQEPSRVRRN